MYTLRMLWGGGVKRVSQFCTAQQHIYKCWGTQLTRTLTVFVLLGGKVYVAHGNCLIPLPVISHCPPIFDEPCRRSLNFSRSCITHDCPLIRFIAYYGIVHARNCSPIGQNVLYCFKRYNCTYNNFLFGSVNSIVSSFCSMSIVRSAQRTCCLK